MVALVPEEGEEADFVVQCQQIPGPALGDRLKAVEVEAAHEADMDHKESLAEPEEERG